MIRVSDLIDSYRDLLTGALDVYLSTVSNRLNAVMERLTIVATIFLPLTFVTGFFGQNFGWMVRHVDSFAAFMIFGRRWHGGPDRGRARASSGGPATSDRSGAANIEGHNQGTTGFDVVDPWRKWQAEVPGRPRKTTGKTVRADSHEYALAA